VRDRQRPMGVFEPIASQDGIDQHPFRLGRKKGWDRE
jgi:hypothetical protein